MNMKRRGFFKRTIGCLAAFFGIGGMSNTAEKKNITQGYSSCVSEFYRRVETVADDKGYLHRHTEVRFLMKGKVGCDRKMIDEICYLAPGYDRVTINVWQTDNPYVKPEHRLSTVVIRTEDVG